MIGKIKLPYIGFLAAGGAYSLNLPVNQTYKKLFWHLTGVTPAQVKNVELQLNGNLVSRWKSLADVVGENDYYLRDADTTVATMFFARPELKGRIIPQFADNGAVVGKDVVPDLTQQDFYALGTVGVGTCQIKFDIDAAVTGTPAIDVYALTGEAAMPGILTKRRFVHVDVTESGVTEFTDFPKAYGARIAAIHIKGAGIEAVEFEVNSTRWVEKLPAAVNNRMLIQSGRKPQTNQYHLDFINQGNAGDALTITRNIYDMRLKIHSSVSGKAEIIFELLDQYTDNGY